MSRTARGAVSIGFGAVAILLTVASAAFACTTFLGQLTVTTGSGASTRTSIASGGGGSHAWCGTTPQGDAQASSSQTVTVSVAVASQCGTVLPNGVYDVAFRSGDHHSCSGTCTIGGANAWTFNTGAGTDHCGPLSSPTVLGSLTVVGGAGTTQVALPSGLTANSAGKAAALCVNYNAANTPAALNTANSVLYPGLAVGNQVPLIIV